MGTATVCYFNGDYTGRWIDECANAEDVDEIIKCLSSCIATSSAVSRFESFREAPLKMLALHQVYLPCADTGGNPVYVLCGIFGKSFYSVA